jgi:hypothetical protein
MEFQRAMSRSIKIGVVVAGYVAAILIAMVTVWVRNLFIDPAVAMASSGMYAFGDALLFVAVFGLLGLVPKGAALYFLRPYRLFWAVSSTIAVATGVTGLAAAVIFMVGRTAIDPSPLAAWAAFSVLRILIAPLLALTFLLSALISPFRWHRFALLAASLMELAVTAYAAVIWFVPLFVDMLTRS